MSNEVGFREEEEEGEEEVEEGRKVERRRSSCRGVTKQRYATNTPNSSIVFVQIAKLYLSKFENVFVQIAK